MASLGSGEYGHWTLVALNTILFSGFILSVFRPRTRTDWRSLGAFSAFLLALFAEMYGFPLTLYLLWSWLGNKFPMLDPLSHNAGHLWQPLLGLKGDPHFSLLHLASTLLMIIGFRLITSGWKVLHRAVQSGELATTGPYRRVRHPQYLGFIAIMTGFLLQWPTLITLAMYPILMIRYVRLARREESEVRQELGEVYDQYARRTPAFFPRLRG